MRQILLIGLALLIAIPAFSQELSKKEQRKLDKELKKEQLAKENEMQAALVKMMVEHKRFVLEANQLRDKRGNMVNVSSNLNFVAVDSISGVLQIGNNAYVGLNGVGGITEEGSVSGYEYSLNEKNGSYNVKYFLRSPGGTYDVQMVVHSSGRADATISSTWPGRLTYSGFLIPPGASRVWKGTTRY
ncbi:MAG: DUF4251 domain-containing protein [Bacteroidales bacterium]